MSTASGWRTGSDQDSILLFFFFPQPYFINRLLQLTQTKMFTRPLAVPSSPFVTQALYTVHVETVVICFY